MVKRVIQNISYVNTCEIFPHYTGCGVKPANLDRSGIITEPVHLKTQNLMYAGKYLFASQYMYVKYKGTAFAI
jgi:hypothetical protein